MLSAKLNSTKYTFKKQPILNYTENVFIIMIIVQHHSASNTSNQSKRPRERGEKPETFGDLSVLHNGDYWDFSRRITQLMFHRGMSGSYKD